MCYLGHISTGVGNYMNEDQILYYLFLFFVNLGIFASLTTFMVLKGWIPYPGSESKSDTDHISQQSSETISTYEISQNGKSPTSGTPKSAEKRAVDAKIQRRAGGMFSFSDGSSQLIIPEINERLSPIPYPTRSYKNSDINPDAYLRKQPIPNSAR